MSRVEQLKQRLNSIGTGLMRSGHGLALIGLGSVGAETARMDDYSDLDFFAIVEEGYKSHYMQSLDWMEQEKRLVYTFQNTVDGYKAMYEDGIFCEMAIFEPKALAGIPFASPRIIWASESFDLALATPPKVTHSIHGQDWLIGECLTNLYVGLGRYRRGEKLSAMRFVQGYAVDRVLDLAKMLYSEESIFVDPFMVERRIEKRFPVLATIIPAMMQGYEKTPESAEAILAFLNAHFEINHFMKQFIEALIQE